jgi:hypothetical protein
MSVEQRREEKKRKKQEAARVRQEKKAAKDLLKLTDPDHMSKTTLQEELKKLGLKQAGKSNKELAARLKRGKESNTLEEDKPLERNDGNQRAEKRKRSMKKGAGSESAETAKKKQKRGKKGKEEEESSKDEADDMEGISEKNVVKGKRVTKRSGGFYTQLHLGGEAG